MTPTFTASVINSNHLLPLTNKLRKPIVEKMHRECINSSIEKIKYLLCGEFLKQQPDSRQGKADILEMTVYFLRQQQHKTLSCSTEADEGYSRCVQEAINFLSQCQVHTQSQRRLLSHVLTMQPSMEKNRSVVPQQRRDSRIQCPLASGDLVEPQGHSSIRKFTNARLALNLFS